MISASQIFLATVLIMAFAMNNTVLYSQSDNCQCEKDLMYLDAQVQKIPAYRTLNKEKLRQYEDTIKKLKNAAVANPSIYDCFVLLNQLLLLVNDNHSEVYGLPVEIDKEDLKDASKLSAFKQTEIYQRIPNLNINLDSLERSLKAKDFSDVEGIYHSKDYLRIGVFYDEKNNYYKGVVLYSELALWEPGDLMYTLIPYGNNYLKSIAGGLNSRRLFAYAEKIENGRFLFMRHQKNPSEKNYSIAKYPNQTYLREELSDAITYLKVGSFSSYYPTLSDAEQFYETIKGTLDKPHLIIDLRTNSGGGERNSGILFKMLKEYTKKNKLYLIVNHRTVSNAEQFTVRAKGLGNCLVFGDQTNGTLSYEIKGGSFSLPCGIFKSTLGAKKHAKYLDFESKGVKPDVELDYGQEWIKQVVQYIDKNN